jgi:hypothetical protein
MRDTRCRHSGAALTAESDGAVCRFCGFGPTSKLGRLPEQEISPQLENVPAKP